MEIVTARLILRQFKRSDWKEVHEYAKDPEVARFMEWGPNTVDDTMTFIDTSLNFQKEKPRQVFDFAVTLKDTGELIGSCGLRMHRAFPETAEVGYCFNKNYWRQGFASESTAAVIEFGFANFKLHRVFATCDADNTGSAKVMNKCHMRREGHFVKDKQVKGRYRDTLLYAILRAEWEHLRG